MKLFWLILVFVGASVAQESTPDSEQDTTAPPPHKVTYVITASDKLRPGHDFPIYVQTFPSAGNCWITASFVYQKYEENSTQVVLLTTEPQQVFPGVPQTINVKTSQDMKVSENVWDGQYSLRVVGECQTMKFDRVEALSMEEKSLSIFCITDKLKYKEGQTVNFRIFALDPETLGVMNVPMDIFIKDPRGNRIKQYLSVTGKETKGVFQDSLKLADSVPKGEWTLEAVVQGQKKSLTFTVESYVLPQFETTVKAPSFAVVSEPSVSITIQAKYVYGLPVTNGMVQTVTRMYQQWFPPGSETKTCGITRTGKLDQNGEFTFSISTKELQNCVNQVYPSSSLNYMTFEVSVNVTDEITGRMQPNDARFQFFPNIMDVRFLPNSPNTFKPNMTFTSLLQLQKRDNTPLSKEVLRNMEVYVNVTCQVPLSKEEQAKARNATSTSSNTNSNATSTSSNTNSSDDSSPDGKFRSDVIGIWNPWSTTRTQILELDEPVKVPSETGLLPITFRPLPDAVSCSIEAKFNKPFEDEVAYHSASLFQSPSNSFIQISAPVKSPKVGDTTELIIESTEPVKELTFQVFAKGFMVDKGTVTSPEPEGSNSNTLSLRITQAMAPSVTLVVFYIRKENYEVVPDTLSFSIDGIFEKPTSVRFSKEKVQPGQPVSIIINAEEGSTVFLSVVDKSVETMKAGNDLTPTKVEEELDQFSYGPFFSLLTYAYIRSWPFYTGGNNARSAFKAAGTIMITDAFMEEASNNIILYRGGGIMPVAMQAAAQDSASKSGFLPAEHERKWFPEIWKWNDLVVPSGGQLVINETAPDTITTWIASAFSVHEKYGLSVANATAKVITFRDMFVSLSLPDNIIRGDNYCFKAFVFNYFSREIDILLILENDESFKNIYVSREGDSLTTTEESSSSAEYHLGIAPNGVARTTFCITATKLEPIKLNVKALTNVPGLSDAIEQVINVKPEGLQQRINYPSLVNLTSSNWSREVEITFPSDTVEGSKRTYASVSGNIFGKIFENMDNLLQQPYGCGEQNMLNFAPDVSVLKFLKATNSSSPKIEKRAVELMSIGYQTELTYEHDPCGFSAFGKSDKNSSVWLTSFVTRTFAQAEAVRNDYSLDLELPYLNEIISRSVKCIMSCQNENGSFTEYGIVFHKDMQGGSAEGDAFVAYNLITLTEALKVLKDNSTITTEIEASMNLAANYIANRIENITDPYDICIVAYALILYGHPKKDRAFDRMEQMSTVGEGRKSWIRPKYGKSGYTSDMNSINVEATSYALLAYCEKGIAATQGLSIMNWLSDCRNENGGYFSTQDTMIGIQAITCASADLYKAEDIPMTVRVTYTDSDGKIQSEEVKITKETEMLLQHVYVPCQDNASYILHLDASTDSGQSGPSTVLIDVSTSYYRKGENLPEYFDMSYALRKEDTFVELNITVATAHDEEADMSTMELDIPVGYTVDESEVQENNKYISQVDPYKGNVLVMYFNNGVIKKEPILLTFRFYKDSGDLTKTQPRTCKIYLYYSPESKATVTYNLKDDPFCDKVPDYMGCRYMSG